MATSNEEILLDVARTYIDGKMKRYYLLFAVNGGAFAIAQLAKEAAKETALHGETIIVGALQLWHLSLGAIFFTVVVTLDIWFWGRQMRHRYRRCIQRECKDNPIFTPAGVAILILLSSLLISAWKMAADLSL